MCVGCGFIKFSSVFLLDSHQYSDQRDQTGQKNGASGMESTPRCCWSGRLVWVGPIRHLCVAPVQLGHHHVHCSSSCWQCWPMHQSLSFQLSLSKDWHTYHHYRSTPLPKELRSCWFGPWKYLSWKQLPTKLIWSLIMSFFSNYQIDLIPRNILIDLVPGDVFL